MVGYVDSDELLKEKLLSVDDVYVEVVNRITEEVEIILVEVIQVEKEVYQIKLLV